MVISGIFHFSADRSLAGQTVVDAFSSTFSAVPARIEWRSVGALDVSVHARFGLRSRGRLLELKTSIRHLILSAIRRVLFGITFEL
jgi:hypothetical protein